MEGAKRDTKISDSRGLGQKCGWRQRREAGVVQQTHPYACRLERRLSKAQCTLYTNLMQRGIFGTRFKSPKHREGKIKGKRCSYSRKRSPKWRWAAGGKVDQWRGWLRERRKRQECVCRNPDLPRLLRGEGEEKKEEEREGVESITVDPVERVEPCVQIIDMI